MSGAIDVRIKPPMRDAADDPPVVPAPEYGRYDEVYGFEQLLNMTAPELVAEMEASEVRGILQAEHEWGTDAEYNVSPTDARCYPIYSRCTELGVPVGLHTGINFSSHGPIENGRPLLVDRVACEFPDLAIICHHGGWPWPHEAVAVAWKHQNAFLEFGAIRPRYLGNSGGWGDTVHFADTVLRERVLFGTDWPMLRYETALAEIGELGLRDESREAFLHGNAQRLLERIL